MFHELNRDLIYFDYDLSIYERVFEILKHKFFKVKSLDILDESITALIV